jgi:selenobiotic family peptide radical SAM maturase
MLRDRLFSGRKTKVFTLQWHLTNTCRFHCKHCYDRSKRVELCLEEARGVLDLLKAFCRRKTVEGRISLTGGDPFLYPFFWDLYESIAQNGIRVSILGNPISSDDVNRLLEIQRPLYYQVSLEGLKEHNDEMRGTGHFDQTVSFLRTAEGLGLRTHVMLTLTRSNLNQVVPLGEFLRNMTFRFTFNRLSRTGEAVSLDMPTKTEYAAFLKEYTLARKENGVLGFKDNLFNILRHHFRRPLLPGCTGAGCGASFDFVALLPDGEIHACRKYPSPIGNIANSSLLEVYESAEARRYRRGAAACRKCRIRNVCGGCPAVSYGSGLSPLIDLDPHCFMAEAEEFLTGF